MTSKGDNEAGVAARCDWHVRRWLCAAWLLTAALWLPVDSVAAPGNEEWIGPMRRVHARFTGTNGTLAQFGDSITVTMAYWAPLVAPPKNMRPAVSRAHSRVKAYLKPQCWSGEKGPRFGNNGSMTIRWALENVDSWLKRMNPEAVVIMFGSNDVGQMDLMEYESKLREVVQRCLANGTVVLLTAMPPRSGHLDKARQFADAARRISRQEKIPLIDYGGEILKRRPDDWDGSLPQFKGLPGDEYQVRTLIARDGVHPSNPSKYVNDFSDESLRTSGFSLRNYLTLVAYAEVVEKVFESQR